MTKRETSGVVVAAWLALGSALSCGGGPPPESAADVESEAGESEAPDSAASDASGEAEGDTSADKPADESKAPASGAASSDDVREVLQLVVEDEALNPYLHLELPKRFPLKVSGSAYPKGIEVTKATEPVLFVAEAKKDEAVLVFTEIDVGSDTATVRYRYDIEGVRGSATLVKKNGHWELKSSRVTER
jgi:hypothetical protein